MNREFQRRLSQLFGNTSRHMSLGGRAQPYRTTAVVTQLTRESFKDIELRSLVLKDVVEFIEKYKRISSKIAAHGMQMIDFMTMWVCSQLKAKARSLRIIGDEILTDSLANMPDEDIEEILLYCVAAQSTSDYIQKLKTIEFPPSKAEYSNTALNFPSLYKKALVFSHRFCSAALILGMKAEEQHLLSLYKANGVDGLVNHYLNAWPNNTGKKLFKMTVSKDPSLSKKGSISEFATAFLDALEPYTKVRQTVDDLNTVLVNSTSDNRYPSKPRYKSFDQDKPKDNKGNYNKHERFRYLPEHTEELNNVYEEEDVYCDPKYDDIELDDTGEDLEPICRDADASVVGDLEEFDQDLLAAFNMKTPDKSGTVYVPGCYYKYRNGECTKEKDGTCKLDHSREGMIKAQAESIRGLLNAKNGTTYEDIKRILESAYRDKVKNNKPGDGKPAYEKTKRA